MAERGIGDNSSVAADELEGYISRWERLQEERKGLSDDQRDIMNEAKSRGFDVKTMRSVIRLRAMEKHTRDEQAALLDLYKSALGLA